MSDPVPPTQSDQPADEMQRFGEVQVLVCDPAGSVIASEADGLDLIGTAAWQGATLVILPANRLSSDFFQLRTGLAGAITQKFVQYQVRLAVTGDISDHLGDSNALRDFVRESNRGQNLWFLADTEAVRARVGDSGTPT